MNEPSHSMDSNRYEIELPKILDLRGNLSFIESSNHIPFDIKRTYWVYGVPGGEKRGSHAYRKSEEVIVALSGSFRVKLDSGQHQQAFTLKRSYEAIYVPAMHWRELDDFSTNSLALILSSTSYDADDYIRDHQEFLSLSNQ